MNTSKWHSYQSSTFLAGCLDQESGDPKGTTSPNHAQIQFEPLFHTPERHPLPANEESASSNVDIMVCDLEWQAALG
ncbi:hypothetical protein K5D57_21560 [Pseudomonas cichorii]|nr:hypothetical protein [Pseudomonas cichorii]